MSADKYPDMSAMYSVMFAAEDRLKEEIEKLKKELDRTRKALDIAVKRLEYIVLDAEILATPEYLASRAKETLAQINQKEEQ